MTTLNWIDYYTALYRVLTTAYASAEKAEELMKEKLENLQKAHDQWVGHRDYTSYLASVRAISLFLKNKDKYLLEFSEQHKMEGIV